MNPTLNNEAIQKFVKSMFHDYVSLNAECVDKEGGDGWSVEGFGKYLKDIMPDVVAGVLEDYKEYLPDIVENDGELYFRQK